MKWIFTGVLLMTSMAMASEELAKPSSLSIRTKEVASKRKDIVHWKSSSGSHATTTERSRLVEVEITNFGGKPAPGARLSIFWIGKSGSNLYIYGKSEREIELQEIRKLELFNSPDVSERNTEFVVIRERYNSGDRLVGYVAVLNYQDTDVVFASTAASSIRTRSDLDLLLDKSK